MRETIDILSLLCFSQRISLQAISHDIVEVRRILEEIRLEVVLVGVVGCSLELGAVTLLGHVVDDAASVVDDHLSALPVELHAV